MATANIDLADGTKITIEGTPDEIARVLDLYRRSSGPAPPFRQEPGTVSPRADIGGQSGRSGPSRVRSSAMQHIRTLISEQFFGERRSIATVQSKLEELGHIYPQTHLSTPLRRLVMNRELRRLREGKNWVYVDAT